MRERGNSSQESFPKHPWGIFRVTLKEPRDHPFTGQETEALILEKKKKAKLYHICLDNMFFTLTLPISFSR